MRKPDRLVRALGETRGRTIALVTAAALIAFPAGILRVLCVGKSCESSASVVAQTPFCSLPADLRARIAAGFREGRSPNILAVAGRSGIAGADGLGRNISWPGIDTGAAAVPIVFHGAGVDVGADIPEGIELDRVAPSIAQIIGLTRAHPEVRSGTTIPGIASGERPRLVLEVVLKGVGGSAFDDWPELQALMDSGAATTGRVPSTPLDPAATLTTIGTGGLPRQHGITGTYVRSDSGALVRAWGRRSPPSVIATLPDDLDERLRQKPHVGLVADSGSDRGLVGGDWYVDNDRDDRIITMGVVAAARRLLKRDYGRDDVPDLLAVTMTMNGANRDDDLGALVRAASAASGNELLTVVTATGASGPQVGATGSKTLIKDLERAVGADVVEGVAVGGLFVDQDVLAREEVSEEEVVRALRALDGEDGRALMADAFTGIAVSFARYC